MGMTRTNCMTDASDDLTDYKNVAGGTYSSNTAG